MELVNSTDIWDFQTVARMFGIFKLWKACLGFSNCGTHAWGFQTVARMFRIFKMLHSCSEGTSCRGNNLRPYHMENSARRPITEVKQFCAYLILGWVIVWKYHVLFLQIFCFLFIVKTQGKESYCHSFTKGTRNTHRHTHTQNELFL